MVKKIILYSLYFYKLVKPKTILKYNNKLRI